MQVKLPGFKFPGAVSVVPRCLVLICPIDLVYKPVGLLANLISVLVSLSIIAFKPFWLIPIILNFPFCVVLILVIDVSIFIWVGAVVLLMLVEVGFGEVWVWVGVV
jgi:hypothetical protein